MFYSDPVSKRVPILLVFRSVLICTGIDIEHKRMSGEVGMSSVSKHLPSLEGFFRRLCEDCPTSDGVEEEDVDTDAKEAKVFPGGKVEYPKVLN